MCCGTMLRLQLRAPVAGFLQMYHCAGIPMQHVAGQLGPSLLKLPTSKGYELFRAITEQ